MALGQRQVNGELPDHGLAGPGRSGHKHSVALVQSQARPALVVVEGEVVERLELGQSRTVLRPPPP